MALAARRATLKPEASGMSHESVWIPPDLALRLSDDDRLLVLAAHPDVFARCSSQFPFFPGLVGRVGYGGPVMHCSWSSSG